MNITPIQNNRKLPVNAFFFSLINYKRLTLLNKIKATTHLSLKCLSFCHHHYALGFSSFLFHPYLLFSLSTCLVLVLYDFLNAYAIHTRLHDSAVVAFICIRQILISTHKMSKDVRDFKQIVFMRTPRRKQNS